MTFRVSLRTVLGLLSLTALGCAQREAQRAPGAAPDGMVWIPGGRFTMGSESPHALPHERPTHTVAVDGFFMDRDAVTNAQFAAFVNATGYVTLAERVPEVAALLSQLPPGTPPPPRDRLLPGGLVFAPTESAVDLGDWSQWWRWVAGADWRHPEGPQSSIAGKESHPVVQVAWEDAVAFASWAGKRLPTEAEWEFAARGGAEQREYAWGADAFDPARPQAHIYDGTFPTHGASTRPVGSYPPNAYGLRDMSGNVWQWTLDWFHPDTYSADRARGVVRNPVGPAAGMGPGPTRVLRGGSFLCSDSYCRGYRVSSRNSGAPDTGAPNIGFRTVMTLKQWESWSRARGRG
ncbi:MAG TPA: formylglycine-generating enzyme family protein [Gemmatimonadaceae bacterium]